MKLNNLFLLNIVFLLFSCTNNELNQEREIFTESFLFGEWNIYNNIDLVVDESNNYELEYNGRVKSGMLYHTHVESDLVVIANDKHEVVYVIYPKSNNLFFYKYEGNGLDPGQLIGILSNEEPNVDSDIIDFLQGRWKNLDNTKRLYFHNHGLIFNGILDNITYERYISQVVEARQNRSFYLGSITRAGSISQQTKQVYVYNNNMISIDTIMHGVHLGTEFYERIN
ncbi:MAG: hypothetical protein JJU11_18595 [Candidatus Sumerlaeia bacterium]|nr:hypothetical protein [Candidatus Sumerlaeia bacterium]